MTVLRSGSVAGSVLLDGVRLASGRLAGSCLTTDGAFHTLLRLGLDPVEASCLTATLPAERPGESNHSFTGLGLAATLVACTKEGVVLPVINQGVDLKRF